MIRHTYGYTCGYTYGYTRGYMCGTYDYSSMCYFCIVNHSSCFNKIIYNFTYFLFNIY